MEDMNENRIANLLLNFFKLELDKLVVHVAFSMKVGKDVEGLRITAIVNEPTRRLGEKVHAEGQDDSGDHLETPRNAERRLTIHVRATKLNEVLDENTPCDRPVSKTIRCHLEHGAVVRHTIAEVIPYDHGWLAQ
jgi:hypothetical protein